MNFNLNIENLGNIRKANFEIKPLTIIAGENGSGKSFATKSIYTILDTLNKDYITREFISYFSLLTREFDFFDEKLTPKAAVDINFIKNFYENYSVQLQKMLDSYRIADFEDQELLSKEYEVQCLEMIKETEAYYDKRKKLKKFVSTKEHIENILHHLNHILNIVREYKLIVVKEIEKNLRDNFKKNFQVTSLQSLHYKQKNLKNIKFDIDSIGSVSIDEKEELDFSFFSKGIMEIQKLQNIVFIDSPVYLKIRKGLEKNSIFKFHLFYDVGDRYLKGYPLYIEKLYEFLDKKYLDEPDFKELSDELQQLISGKLNIVKSGDIEYVDQKGSSVPLSLTAMGISNIGLIELLLRNNIINKGSFLIIDEPEAHLHPKWQVALVEILYKVAQAGANIIIATHSIDMIKAVELIIKKDKEAHDLIGLNKMPYNEKFSKLNNEQKIEEILSDLSSPFYEMYIKGMV